MILVTVGTQFPFDRMVKVVDDWAVEQDRSDVMAQIGPSRYEPVRLNCFPFSSPAELRRLQEDCSLMVAHAGMGSIVTALELGKPIIVMPRDHERGEHRNGHQMATVRRFRGMRGVYVAHNEEELAQRLGQIDALLDAGADTSLSSVASSDLIDALRAHLGELFPGQA